MMIHPKIFYNRLQKRGIGFFAGVPDSLLKNFCAYLDDHCASNQHVITANEGNAVALAAGYHLSTGSVAAVYMQNSGLGNAINPLTSLADPEVYKIPMLLIIGWRGEPGIKDEPQHIKQGRITTGQLALMEIPTQILDKNSNLDVVVDSVFAEIESKNAPVALLVRKGTFSPYSSAKRPDMFSSLTREDALSTILTLAGEDALIVSTTGKTSREVFEIRARSCQPQRDFLTVGSMGHTASIALGIALGNPQKRVICLDGDGSALMHLGAIPIIGDLQPSNLVYVLLNNAAHESVGGQQTVADKMDFSALFRACGFQKYYCADTIPTIKEIWKSIDHGKGPHMMEIRISIGSRDDLGRPMRTPLENKRAFMECAIG